MNQQRTKLIQIVTIIVTEDTRCDEFGQKKSAKN